MRSWMSSIFVLLCLAFSAFGLSLAEDPPPKDEAKDADKASTKNKKESSKGKFTKPENLVPVYRFYNERLNEHVYSTNEDELSKWRNISYMKEQCIIGQVSPVGLVDTTRLWRAVRTDGRHYHYLQAPGKAGNITVEHQVFGAFVWKRPAEGRVPIYSTTWTDCMDVFFERDLNAVRKFKDDSKKALGVDRLPFAGKNFVTPVFYVYPPADTDEEAEKPKDAPKK